MERIIVLVKLHANQAVKLQNNPGTQVTAREQHRVVQPWQGSKPHETQYARTLHQPGARLPQMRETPMEHQHEAAVTSSSLCRLVNLNEPVRTCSSFRMDKSDIHKEAAKELVRATT